MTSQSVSQVSRRDNLDNKYILETVSIGQETPPLLWIFIETCYGIKCLRYVTHSGRWQMWQVSGARVRAGLRYIGGTGGWESHSWMLTHSRSGPGPRIGGSASVSNEWRFWERMKGNILTRASQGKWWPIEAGVTFNFNFIKFVSRLRFVSNRF